MQLLSELPQAFAEEQGLTLAEAEQRCQKAARDVNALIGEGSVSTIAAICAALHLSSSMQTHVTAQQRWLDVKARSGRHAWPAEPEVC